MPEDVYQRREPLRRKARRARPAVKVDNSQSDQLENPAEFDMRRPDSAIENINGHAKDNSIVHGRQFHEVHQPTSPNKMFAANRMSATTRNDAGARRQRRPDHGCRPRTNADTKIASFTADIGAWQDASRRRNASVAAKRVHRSRPACVFRDRDGRRKDSGGTGPHEMTAHMDVCDDRHDGRPQGAARGRDDATTASPCSSTASTLG